MEIGAIDVAAMSKKLAEEIKFAAIMGALAYNAIHGLQADSVSEREAYKQYGSGWVRDRTRRGLLQFQRNGPTSRSTKVYSRFNIESLKRAENGIEEAYQTALKQAQNI